MGVLHALPVVLPSAQITIPLNAPNTILSAQPGIRNTESVGVLIDKIVFTCLSTTTVARALYVEVKWNNEHVTNGLVSINAVAWPRNRGVELQTSSFVLECLRPIYLEPGDYLSISISTSGFAGFNPASTITATAIGRQCSAPPNERYLPYFCAYEGPVYAVNSGVVISNQSTPADLGNPFSTPLFVDRMIGRVLSIGAGLIGLADRNPSPMWNTFGMRVSDHRDNFWVANPTALPLVCNTIDRSWILHHTLESKGFLRVEFEGIANIADPIVAITQAQAVVGLVGYRRIA